MKSLKSAFNDGWQFKMQDESEWKSVKIPHDWLIKDTHNLYKTGVGMYRKIFDINSDAGEKVFLNFDGVYMDTSLSVNGKHAGEWKNGYTSHIYDITDYINPNQNEVILTVNHAAPNSRWYSGAGIYRNCWLIQKDEVHFVHDGVYISTIRQDEDVWRVEIVAEIECFDETCKVEYKIKNSVGDNVLNADSHVISHVEVCTNRDIYASNGKLAKTIMLFNSKVDVKNPAVWDIDNPVCYELEASLTIDGEIFDIMQVRFGFREIEYTVNDGFFLNRRRVDIQGVCLHHDLGCLGAAINKDALRRQFLIMQEMGVNALRTAHNPPAIEFMELADEMGFLVMTEFTDVWRRRKTTHDYAQFFDTWAEKDVAAWVRRDRNCPSVIMWSIGNEIYDTHADFEEGSKTMQFLMKQVEMHDYKKNASITLCTNYMPWENTQKCADIIKLVGYNYAEYLYNDHHLKHPDWIIYGGETAATVQSRGVYHFPLKKALLADDDLQCSALGNSATSWGAKSVEHVIKDHKNATFALGQFLWTGIDYIGEPTPYHTKNAYFGQVDTAGFMKDSFYIYKAGWTNYKDAPFVHVFPYWDFSPGQPIDVRIASNAPQVELFLNGKSLGRYDNDLTTSYIVPYEKGTIKAIAYDENGNILAVAERYSFGDAVRPVVNTTQIGTLIFAEISAVDIDGNPVENANNRVCVTVEGGVLLGLDNGDSTDYDQYQNTNTRHLFNGKLMAVVKPNKEEAKISAAFDNSFIPIRKIELIRDLNDPFKVTAITYPIQSSKSLDNALEWRIADESGIDSPLAHIEVINPTQVIVRPKGDGEVYVRCATKNDRSHVSLISLLPMTITGYGKPFLNPYDFISGGLYNLSNVPMTNGNERGIATLRDSESQFGFSDLDFGAYGSDEIKLWLFPLAKDEFPIEVWQGMPTECESKKITTLIYNKGSIWNTYIEASYLLPYRLKGVQTLAFVFNQKVHVKGFQFTQKNKAYEKLNFTENDQIYGDSFEINEYAVEKIGNNVTITFTDMHFEKPTKDIQISWRAPQDKNTIKIVFTNKNGHEISEMLLLPASQDYAIATLPLYLQGEGTLNFIFLPGSNIDLKWFQLTS